MTEIIEPNPGRSRQQWAQLINAAWRSSVEGVIETGRLLLESKIDIGHGEFLGMVERDLPFGEDTAERLIAIYRNFGVAYEAIRERMARGGPGWAPNKKCDCEVCKKLDD